MELRETVELMQSDDYKERFRAEYYQLKIRYEKLKKMLNSWDSLNFKPTCEKDLYLYQLNAMQQYLGALTVRAKKERIKL